MKKLDNFINRFNNKFYDSIRPFSSVYGKFYAPIYNRDAPFNYTNPEYYNKDGSLMEPFFLRDFHSAHEPYFFKSKYFFMDRFNFGLDTHFYTHNCMLEQMGKPVRKYGLLYESPSIVPDDYLIFNKHQGLEKDFDLIFTYSTKILDSVSNSRFVPFMSIPWYGNPLHGGGLIDSKLYKKKSKNISIVSSDKRMCLLHEVRYSIAKECKSTGLADTFGTFDGGAMIPIKDSLENYRYSIVIENEIDDLYFTERITNCFLSMTVPIYLGARKISNYFNSDGIITFSTNDVNKLRALLSNCNEKDYKARIPAIKDNFERVQKYNNLFDWVYEDYLTR